MSGETSRKKTHHLHLVTSTIVFTCQLLTLLLFCIYLISVWLMRFLFFWEFKVMWVAAFALTILNHCMTKTMKLKMLTSCARRKTLKMSSRQISHIARTAMCHSWLYLTANLILHGVFICYLQGKFIRINFDVAGYIVGANIETCILTTRLKLFRIL